MSDNKHPISEFIIKFLLNCLIALILCFFLFMFLFGASIGVNYFKDSDIFLKIIMNHIFTEKPLLIVVLTII